jgi:hypothetical protein
MFRKTFFLSVLALLLVFPAFSQKEQTVMGGRNFGLTGIWGGYKHQITQFGNTNSYIRGGNFGLEFGKTLFVGFGKYRLTDDFDWDQIQNQNFDMNWSVLDLSYAFQGYRAIHPMVNLNMGPGKVKLSGEGEDNIFVIQPAAGVEINVFRWFHIGLEGGYRFVTDSSLPSLSDDALSGAYGQASLKFGFSWGRYKKRDRFEGYND